MNYKKFEEILNGRLTTAIGRDQKEFIKKCLKEFYLEKMTVKELGEHFEKSLELSGIKPDKGCEEDFEELKDKLMEAICNSKVAYDRANHRLIEEKIIEGDFGVILDKLFG